MKSKRKEKDKRARPQPHLAFRPSAATLSTFQMPPADGETSPKERKSEVGTQPLGATYSAEQRALAMEQLMQQNTSESATTNSTAPSNQAQPSVAGQKVQQGRPSSARFWTSFALAAAKKRLLLAKGSTDGVRDAVTGPPQTGAITSIQAAHVKQRSLSEVGKQMFVDGTQSFPSTPIHVASVREATSPSKRTNLPVAQLVDQRVPPAAFFAAAAPPQKFEFSSAAAHVAAAQAAAQLQQVGGTLQTHPSLSTLSHPAAVAAAQRVAAAAQHQQALAFQQQQQRQRGSSAASSSSSSSSSRPPVPQQPPQQPRPPMFLASRPQALNTMLQQPFPPGRDDGRQTPVQIKRRSHRNRAGDHSPSYFHRPSYERARSDVSRPSTNSVDAVDAAFRHSNSQPDEFNRPSLESNFGRSSFDIRPSFTERNSFTDRNSFLSVTDRNSFVGRPSAEEYARVLRQTTVDDAMDDDDEVMPLQGATQLGPSLGPGLPLATFPSNQSQGSVFAARSSMQLSPNGSGGWTVPLEGPAEPPSFPSGFRWDVLAGEAGDGAEDDDLVLATNNLGMGIHPPPSLVDDVVPT